MATCFNAVNDGNVQYKTLTALRKINGSKNKSEISLIVKKNIFQLKTQ